MEEIRYRSTRNHEDVATASQAILNGLSKDGGLYMPEKIPAFDIPLARLAGLSYSETAYEVMSRFYTDFTEEELKYCIEHAYDSKFDTEEIAPLVKADGAYYLELFHGPTIAFKDMALSILPYLMTTAAKKNEIRNEIVILTATSGDTGKAALAGFADVPRTKIIVFFPEDGVSPVQKKQMVTQKGANTFVVGVRGNFDDCQSGVKAMFGDPELKKELEEKGYQFSSANSINIGRLIPQVVYYVYAYGRLLAQKEIEAGEAINVVVPTGNFGNILAAYLAKGMGLPIDRLICASNDNRVLTDFFETGVYDKNRPFLLTSSPSMDILISSNLERLIYEIAGKDAEKTGELMERLKTVGRYELTGGMREGLKDFVGGCAVESEVSEEIAGVYRRTGYLLDTHTAVASKVYRDYVRESRDTKKSVIASTASPYKFTRSVLTAVDSAYDQMGDFELADELSRLSKTKIPQAIEEIRSAEILHKTVCEIDGMEAEVRKFLGL